MYPVYMGMEMPARIATMTATISSSIRVMPLSDFNDRCATLFIVPPPLLIPAVPVQRLADGLRTALEKHTATLAFPKAIASVSKGCPLRLSVTFHAYRARCHP
jgi:hypothetical protein